MSRRLLIETRMNSLSLCESTKQSKHPGCLGTISGPCASYKDPTRNGRFYSRKLWENTFNDEIVKESLQDRILIGELDHPGDRLETKATNACIVMTGYEFNDENGTVDGTFDILDTPNGRILRNLLDYGCKLGVSSRGEGDVFDDSTYGERVDEDNYLFVGFDAVVLPAVKVAKPTLRESLDPSKVKSLKESLATEIKSATDASQLNLIRQVVEATELPDADSLLESVDNKLQELKDGTASSSQTSLLEDLESATTKISELEEDNRKLSRSVTASKEAQTKLTESRDRLADRVRRYQSRFNEYKSENSKLQNESLELSLKLASESKKSEALSAEVARLQSRIETLESLNASRLTVLRSVRAENQELKESLSESESTIGTLRAKLRESSSKIKSLRESLASKDAESRKRIDESAKRASSQKQSYNGLLDAYIEEVSCREGVDPNSVKTLLGKGTATHEKVLEAVSRLRDAQDRYDQLPITGDISLKRIVESARQNSDQDGSDEHAATKSFMANAAQYF